MSRIAKIGNIALAGLIAVACAIDVGTAVAGPAPAPGEPALCWTRATAGTEPADAPAHARPVADRDDDAAADVALAGGDSRQLVGFGVLPGRAPVASSTAAPRRVLTFAPKTSPPHTRS